MTFKDNWSRAAFKKIAKKANAKLHYCSRDSSFVLFQGDCRLVLESLKKSQISPSLIYADPPYNLSNDGITCSGGRMVSVNKGKWDKSSGAKNDHAFNLDWLKSSLDSLSPNGAIWVSGSQHNIYSVGFALQQLGAKLLNTIVWAKPAPPPNLSCRYYTHSHEFIIWAKKSKKAKHTYHYDFEKAQNNNKQQKDIWHPKQNKRIIPNHWRVGRPRKEEKMEGKHPTQKPVELLDRIIRCSSNPKELILDPMCGSGTAGISANALGRRFIGIDINSDYLEIARKRFQYLNKQEFATNRIKRK